SGLMFVDQRQPGSNVPLATVRPATVTTSAMPLPSKALVSSGLSNVFTSTTAIALTSVNCWHPMPYAPCPNFERRSRDVYRGGLGKNSASDAAGSTYGASDLAAGSPLRPCRLVFGHDEIGEFLYRGVRGRLIERDLAVLEHVDPVANVENLSIVVRD